MTSDVIDAGFGNGIFDASGAHALTPENCPPLFASAPVILGSGSQQMFEVCHL